MQGLRNKATSTIAARLCTQALRHNSRSASIYCTVTSRRGTGTLSRFFNASTKRHAFSTKAAHEGLLSKAQKVAPGVMAAGSVMYISFEIADVLGKVLTADQIYDYLCICPHRRRCFLRGASTLRRQREAPLAGSLWLYFSASR